jgi:hypothetical protein
MVEKSMEGTRPGAVYAPLADVLSPVVYGITALRYRGGVLSEVMLGMFDGELERWELQPAPTRLVEVVDRLVEGDTVISLFPTERGVLQAGPEVKVDVLAGGAETLALAEERPGRRLSDLPRF